MSTLVAAWPATWPRERSQSRAANLPMDSSPTDAELLERIGRSDREAFHLFYDRYAGRLLAYVRQIARRGGSPEDVVQDVFLAVWRKAKTYRRERGNVAGWLYTITRNRVVDRWRRKGGLVEDDGFDLAVLEAPELDDGDRATAISVRRALDVLNPEQRSAIELAYFGGLTYQEAAERLDLPLGTLKSRIRAGLALLRERLETAPEA